MVPVSGRGTLRLKVSIHLTNWFRRETARLAGWSLARPVTALLYLVSIGCNSGFWLGVDGTEKLSQTPFASWRELGVREKFQSGAFASANPLWQAPRGLRCAIKFASNARSQKKTSVL